MESAFKNLKDDWALRTIYHQLEQRIEAHIFISFQAYGLPVTLRRHLRDLTPGLTPRSVLEKFATMQMRDMHLPTTNERTVILSRHPHPETNVQLFLQRPKLELPAQPTAVQNHPSKVIGRPRLRSEDPAKPRLDLRPLAFFNPSNPPSRVRSALKKPPSPVCAVRGRERAHLDTVLKFGMKRFRRQPEA